MVKDMETSGSRRPCLEGFKDTDPEMAVDKETLGTAHSTVGRVRVLWEAGWRMSPSPLEPGSHRKPHAEVAVLRTYVKMPSYLTLSDDISKNG